MGKSRFGWRKAIEAQVVGSDEMARNVMDAYSAGVNAYIGTQPLPPEFARPEVAEILSAYYQTLSSK